MRVQLDLTTEAENMLQFRQDFANSKSVVFPRPILPLCYPDVIVQVSVSSFRLYFLAPKNVIFVAVDEQLKKQK